MVVVTHGEDDGRNAVCRARGVAPAEAPLAAAAVVQADVAQEPRVDDGLDAAVVGARGVHPRLRRRLPPSPIIAPCLDLGGRQPHRRRRRAGARIGPSVRELPL